MVMRQRMDRAGCEGSGVGFFGGEKGCSVAGEAEEIVEHH